MTGKKAPEEGAEEGKKVNFSLTLNHQTILFLLTLVGSIAGGASVNAVGGSSAVVADSLSSLPHELRETKTEISNTQQELRRQKSDIDSTKLEVRDIKGMVEDLFCDKYPKNFRCRSYR